MKLYHTICSSSFRSNFFGFHNGQTMGTWEDDATSWVLVESTWMAPTRSWYTCCSDLGDGDGVGCQLGGRGGEKLHGGKLRGSGDDCGGVVRVTVCHCQNHPRVGLKSWVSRLGMLISRKHTKTSNYSPGCQLALLVVILVLKPTPAMFLSGFVSSSTLGKDPNLNNSEPRPRDHPHSPESPLVVDGSCRFLHCQCRHLSN